MARLSKTSQFTIFDDAGIPTPDLETTSDIPPHDYLEVKSGPQRPVKPTLNAANNDDIRDPKATQEIDNNAADADDERRASSLTVSTMPESTYNIEHELLNTIQTPYTPTIIRPSFRRPESIRKMQMSSPRQSPRQSMVLYSRSRNSTPKSVRSATARGSPRPRSRISEETDVQLDTEEQHFPLVLLHVTLLPVDMPWSAESLQELLPERVLENLKLLKSKVSETILSRGILIAHPREEYELLEERLLEALELKTERVTKCGHFQARNQRDSSSSLESDGAGGDSDSGVGSSVEGEEGEVCGTCKCHIKTSRTAVGRGDKKWSVKVFAANGMMKASAWAAAHADMERVDVEILPWFGEDVRRALDERREQEEAEARERLEGEEERIKLIVEEQVRVASEELKRRDEFERRTREREAVVAEKRSAPSRGGPVLHSTTSPTQDTPSETKTVDPSQACHPEQIPVTTLLKNYLFLLAQDRRNVVIFFLCFVAFFLALRPLLSSRNPIIWEEMVALQPSAPAQGLTTNETVPLLELPYDSVLTDVVAALNVSEALPGGPGDINPESDKSDADELDTMSSVDLNQATSMEESESVSGVGGTSDDGDEDEKIEEPSTFDSDALEVDAKASERLPEDKKEIDVESPPSDDLMRDGKTAGAAAEEDGGFREARESSWMAGGSDDDEIYD